MTYSINGPFSQHTLPGNSFMHWQPRTSSPFDERGSQNQRIQDIFKYNCDHQSVKFPHKGISFCSNNGDIGGVLKRLSAIPLSQLNCRYVNYAIKACLINKNFKRALTFFNSLNELSLKPNVYSYNYAMEACLKSGDVAGVFDMFHAMRRNGVSPNWYSYSYLVGACLRSGKLDSAFELLNKVHKAGCDINRYTYRLFVKVCAQQGAFSQAKLLMARFKPNRQVYHCLIEAYVKSGDAIGAFELFDEMVQKGFALHSETYHCLDRLDYQLNENVSSMLKQKFPKSFPVYLESKKTCSRYEQRLVSSLSSHHVVEPTQTQQNPLRSRTSPSALLGQSRQPNHHMTNQEIDFANQKISYYSRKKDIKKAEQVFKQIPDNCKNMYTYGKMIKAYVQNGAPLKVFGIWQLMHASHFLPNRYIYAWSMKACLNAGIPNEVFTFHNMMVERGVQQDVYTCNCLMDAYLRSEKPLMVFHVLDAMHQNEIDLNAYSYHCLIKGCIKSGNLSDVLDVFNFVEEMVKFGINPNSYTYALLMEACGLVGDVQKAKKLIDEKKVKPTRINYNLLIKAHLKGGDPLGAHQVFHKMVEKHLSPADDLLNEIYALAREKLEFLSKKNVALNSQEHLANAREKNKLQKMLKIQTTFSQVTASDRLQPKRGSLAVKDKI